MRWCKKHTNTWKTTLLLNWSHSHKIQPNTRPLGPRSGQKMWYIARKSSIFPSFPCFLSPSGSFYCEVTVKEIFLTAAPTFTVWNSITLHILFFKIHSNRTSDEVAVMFLFSDWMFDGVCCTGKSTRTLVWGLRGLTAWQQTRLVVGGPAENTYS